MKTSTADPEDGIYRVSIYTGFPKTPIPSEKTRPLYGEYYEWTGFTNLRLDDNGCLQPGKLLPGALIEKHLLWMYVHVTYVLPTVDKNEAGKFITSNSCPPTPYTTSTIDAPDIENPYYHVQKSREKSNTRQPQTFLQPDFDYAEPSPLAFAPTGIAVDKVAEDAAFSGSDAEFFGPVVAAGQVATTPVLDDTRYGWDASPISFVQKLKQRRGIKRRRGVERVVGGMT